MLHPLIFLVLFFLITRSSRRIFQAIHRLDSRLTPRWHSVWYFFSLLLLPGTILHESAHLITASLLFVKTGSMNFFPRFHSQKGITLGTAQVASTDFLRLSLIGVAPLVFGLAALYFLYRWFLPLPPLDSAFPASLSGLPAVLARHPALTFLALYLTLAINNTLHTSPSDRQAWPLLLVFVALLVLANFFLRLVDPALFLARLPVAALAHLNAILLLALILNLLLAALLSLPLKLVQA